MPEPNENVDNNTRLNRNVPFAGFRFKQFSVAHDKCAMKVGTDSIMLGSWTQPNEDDVSILDIGSGSGVLTLMMAQQASNKAHIVGVETDYKAYRQSVVNAFNSPFNDQVNFVQAKIQHFYSSNKYQLILSNPPYYHLNQFQEGIADKHLQRIKARSQLTLSHDELLRHVHRLLESTGRFCCVIPTPLVHKFEHLALQYGLYLNQRLDVHSGIYNVSIRSLLTFSYQKSILATSRLVIYDTAGGYTPEYQSLCKDFYLNF